MTATDTRPTTSPDRRIRRSGLRRRVMSFSQRAEPLGPQVLALPLHLARSSSCSRSSGSSRSPTPPSSRSRTGTSCATPAPSSGFDQYIWILSQTRSSGLALRNTFSIFLLSSVPQLILALFIAAMLDRNIRAKTFWRMSVLLPFVMAPVAVALIFSNMFGDNHGLVNNILANIGLGRSRGTRDPFWSHIAIATMVNFRWTGYNTLILLAAMQAVPRDYYEAATVDGAGAVPPVLRASRSRRCGRRSSSSSSPRRSAACRSSTSRACTTRPATAAPTSSG